MIDIIFIIFAVYAVFAKKISLSSTSEIIRPRTYYWAIVTIISVTIAEIIGRNYDTLATFGYIIVIIIPIAAIFILKNKKSENLGIIEQSKSKKIENIVVWVFLIGLVLFFVALYIYDLIKLK